MPDASEDRTIIRKAGWAIVWDEGRQDHAYLRDADIVFEGGTIRFVGQGYDGPAGRVIDGRGRMVMPGFVNIHSHPSSEPLRKGITDETRSPGFWHSSLYEYLTVFESGEPAAMRACLQVALAELLASGVTSLVDFWFDYEGWLDTLAESGMRVCVAPMFRDAQWRTADGHSLAYDWDIAGGRAGLETAIRTIDRANQHPSGRLSGMMAPAQVDTCTAELIQDAAAHAAARNLRFHIHAAQSPTEFHEIARRHGCTPIQWLDRLGVLNERAIVAHAIFLDHHPWLHWPGRRDMDLLRDTGTSVAHCPTVFQRRGITLRTLGGYLRHGINVGIGTDTYPHNFLDEMRNAIYAARIIGETVEDLTTAELYRAATAGGAQALGRDDIGALAVGRKADIVLVDLDHPAMRPLREPLRSLLYVAAERAVRDVFVDGVQVVRDGRVLTIDLDSALAVAQEAQDAVLRKVPERDWAGRSADELAPMALPWR